MEAAGFTGRDDPKCLEYLEYMEQEVLKSLSRKPMIPLLCREYWTNWTLGTELNKTELSAGLTRFEADPQITSTPLLTAPPC